MRQGTEVFTMDFCGRCGTRGEFPVEGDSKVCPKCRTKFLVGMSVPPQAEIEEVMVDLVPEVEEIEAEAPSLEPMEAEEEPRKPRRRRKADSEENDG